MKNTSTDAFQEKVGSLLIRNSNILDILTKCQTSCARMCRSTIKSATGCGCIEIHGKKGVIAFNSSAAERLSAGSCIDGELCRDCRSIIENEIGESLFYIASLCNVLGISMKKITQKEIERVESLGKYSLH